MNFRGGLYPSACMHTHCGIKFNFSKIKIFLFFLSCTQTLQNLMNNDEEKSRQKQAMRDIVLSMIAKKGSR